MFKIHIVPMEGSIDFSEGRYPLPSQHGLHRLIKHTMIPLLFPPTDNEETPGLHASIAIDHDAELTPSVFLRWHY